MDIRLASPGKYVVAVSGGVDSMALLHALSRQPEYDLIVAHVDHGIRSDSGEDRRLVGRIAGGLGLPFVYHEARLGSGTGEAQARAVRYDFLQRVRQEHDARAVVTAHHQGDVLETAIINLLRGTGRKGLTALASREDVERPLLDIPKQDLLDYAREHGLEWREDSTNQDTDYLRNYVRHVLLPRFDDEGCRQLREIITGLRTTNTLLDELIAGQLTKQQVFGQLDREWFNSLPHDVAKEIMAAWLRYQGIRDFDSKGLERLVVAAKTGRSGKTFDVRRGTSLKVAKRHLALTGASR